METVPLALSHDESMVFIYDAAPLYTPLYVYSPFNTALVPCCPHIQYAVASEIEDTTSVTSRLQCILYVNGYDLDRSASLNFERRLQKAIATKTWT